MLDPVRLTNQVEAHLSVGDRVPVAWLLSELDAIVRQDRMDAVWHRFQYCCQEFPSGLAVCFVHKPRHGKFAGPVYSNKEIELALSGAQLGDINVEITYWIAFELLSLRLVALHVWQTRDAVSLKATMQ